jgi:hypothetical protein
VETEIKQEHKNFKNLECELKKLTENEGKSYEILNLTDLCKSKITEYTISNSHILKNSEIIEYVEENMLERLDKSSALLEFISSLKSDGFTTYFKDENLFIKWMEVEKRYV